MAVARFWWPGMAVHLYHYRLWRNLWFPCFIGSGTTPKLVDKWSDILPVAFGAMLAECVVGVMALIAATALHPADYFAINSSPAAFASLGMNVVDLPQPVEKKLVFDSYGRTGGAVTLAVSGMSYIFTKISWFNTLASYFSSSW